MRRAAPLRSSGIALALIAFAGCDSLPPPPVITGVIPSEGLTDQSSFLTVSGTGFSVRVYTDFEDPNQSRTDDTYKISVGGVELTGVQHVSTTQLTGTLPVGVPVGFSDVSVVDPWIRTATLARAFYGFPPGGPPTALALTGAPANVPLGACQVVEVEQRNAGGMPTVDRNPLAVTLAATPGSAFGVFADVACTSAITTATIGAGETSVDVYVQSTVPGSGDLDASATGLGSATHAFVFGPTQIAFGTGAASAQVAQCSSVVTVVTRDPAGGPSAVGTPTTVTLTVSPATGLALYDASGCMGSTVSEITIPAGSSSAGFYFKGVGATGPYQVTAAAAGLGTAQQMETINAAPDSFAFASIGAQAVHTPFLITVEAVDALGNPLPSYGSAATLAGQGGATLSCLSNCANLTTTTPFLAGKWSGWVRSSTAASAAAIRATSTTAGTMIGTSPAFPVLAPDAGFGVPSARLSVRPGAVGGTGAVVTLDATLSSDYDGGTANLQYSFDALGTATAAAGTPPGWTSWSSLPTSTGTGYSTGITWQPRVAVRQAANPTVISYAAATVVSVSSTVCVVNTTSVVDDNANTCSPPPPGGVWGPDGVLSLPEAIRLTNGSSGRAITTSTALRFYFPPGAAALAVNGGTRLSFATGTQLINAPLDFTGTGVLVANAEISGTRTWTVSGGDLTVSDAVAHDFAGFLTDRPLTLWRLLAFNCPPTSACAEAVGPNGSLTVRFSDFRDAPDVALEAAPAAAGGPCPSPAIDVQSSAFRRTGTGIRHDCTSPSSVVHSTFHENLTGISYAGGGSHTLQNSIFSRNATAASCGSATFTAKDYNMVFSNGADGCAGGDTNTLSGVDPLYFLPEAGDLRVRASSQARDSMLNLGLDVNDVGPGNFFGAGPDRGGSETP